MSNNIPKLKCLAAIHQRSSSDWPSSIILAYWTDTIINSQQNVWEAEFDYYDSYTPDELGMLLPEEDDVGIWCWEGTINHTPIHKKYLDSKEDKKDDFWTCWIGDWRKANLTELKLLQNGTLFSEHNWKKL